jgi:hypothetical protein
MPVLTLNRSLDSEESATSALLQLESEAAAIIHLWSMDIPCNTDRAWFFMLKLVHELEHVPSTSVSGLHGCGMGALWYAKQAQTCLSMMRENLPDYLGNGDLFVTFECHLETVRLEMYFLLLNYPGSSQPVDCAPLIECNPAF